MAKSATKASKSPSSGGKIKGENFYHDKAKIARRNMLNGGKAIRNRQGKIIKEAEFAKSKPDSPVVRVEPNRKWFGNTRTMTIENIEKFKTEIERRSNDPYQILLRQSKLPMSLLLEPKKTQKMNLLEVESFSSTFGKSAVRKRPKLGDSSLEDFVGRAEDENSKHSVSSSIQTSSQPRNSPDNPDLSSSVGLLEGSFDQAQDRVFKKGQSKRIWNELYKVIDSSDVVVHVLDSRDPLGTLCKRVETFIENEAKHKHLIYLLNKCDLIPPGVTSKWIEYLSKRRPTLAFRASINNPYGKGSLISLLRQYSKLHPERKQVSVGFVGYPNTGKSSIINSLRKKKVCTSAPIPGQTKVWQYVTLMKKIYLIDCPGIVPHAHEDSETDLVLKGAIRIENIKSPEDHVPSVLERIKPEYLTKVYSVSEWKCPLDFLSKAAKLKGRLLKGGEPDIPTMARMVLNDWIRGELPYFVPPPSE